MYNSYNKKSRNRAAIISFVISTPLKGEPATIIRGSRPVRVPVKVDVERMLVFIIGQTIIPSCKDVEIRFRSVQRVSHGQIWMRKWWRFTSNVFSGSRKRLSSAVRWQSLEASIAPRPLFVGLFRLSYDDQSPLCYTEAHRRWLACSWQP